VCSLWTKHPSIVNLFLPGPYFTHELKKKYHIGKSQEKHWEMSLLGFKSRRCSSLLYWTLDDLWVKKVGSFSHFFLSLALDIFELSHRDVLWSRIRSHLHHDMKLLYYTFGSWLLFSCCRLWQKHLLESLPNIAKLMSN